MPEGNKNIVYWCKLPLGLRRNEKYLQSRFNFFDDPLGLSLLCFLIHPGRSRWIVPMNYTWQMFQQLDGSNERIHPPWYVSELLKWVKINRQKYCTYFFLRGALFWRFYLQEIKWKPCRVRRPCVVRLYRITEILTAPLLVKKNYLLWHQKPVVIL